WARHNAFAGTLTSPMLSRSIRYSVSAIDGMSLLGRGLARWWLRQRVRGAAVAGEVDRGVFVELGQPVKALDHPQRARLRTHHDRLGGAAARLVAHALEQVAVGDAGRAEEDVLPRHQVAGGQHLIEVVTGVECLLPLGVVLRCQLRLNLAAHAA